MLCFYWSAGFIQNFFFIVRRSHLSGTNQLRLRPALRLKVCRAALSVQQLFRDVRFTRRRARRLCTSVPLSDYVLFHTG